MEKITDSQRFQHTASSLRFCSHALTELNALMPSKPSKEVYTILSREPFAFYRASLTYVVVTEYYKLLERGKVDSEKPRLSSLFCLINELVLNTSEQIKVILEKCLLELSNLKESILGKRVIAYRLKKFAHSDNADFNQPFNIPVLTREEIEGVFNHLKTMELLMNYISTHDEITFELVIPLEKTLTKNFLKNTTIARKYYFENFRDAFNKGYKR